MLPLLLILFYPVWATARNIDVCDLIDLPNCRGVSKQNRRTSNYSAPSPATAANLNPANVSIDRGFGVEGLLQSNNPVAFNLVGGSGKFGGALISPTMENSFFGVRVPELDEEFLKRNRDQRRFDSKKLNLALGGKIVRQKNYGLDFGILLKRHSEVEKIRTGLGFSGRWGLLNVGASYYKDDFWIDLRKTINPATGLPYSQTFGEEFTEESFHVRTVSVGIKVKNFSFDYGKIITDKYAFTDDINEITILSASMTAGHFLFNLGFRKEDSPTPEFIDDEIKDERVKRDTYLGVQYSWWKPLVVGLNYNYFLLNELSATVTVFIR